MLTSRKTYLGIQTSIYRDGGLFISGDPQVGGVLTANNAAAVQWQVAGVDVSGQTALTYTVLLADVGKLITARSTSGTIETSNALTAIAAVTAPTTILPPLVVGIPTAGTPLVINAATFAGSTPTVERTIYGSAEPSNQILARGPVASTSYTPNTTDATRTFIVVDQATNAAGTVRAVSPRSLPAVSPNLSLRAISDRTYLNEFRSGTFKSVGGYRTIKLGSAGSFLELTCLNWFVRGYANGTATYLEEGSGGPARWTAAVEWPAGVFNQAKALDGQTFGIAPDGGEVKLYATFDFPEGVEVKIHYLQFQTGAGTCVFTGVGSSGTAPTVTSTAAKDLTKAFAGGIVDATMTGNWAAAGGNDITGNGAGPNIVCGMTAKPSVLILGTSIDMGVGGTQATVFNSGLICQQLSSLNIGFTNGGIQADSIRRLLLSNDKRVALANSSIFSNIVLGGPVNDVSSNSPAKTAAEMFADMRTEWALFPGKNLIQQTMTPMTDAGNSPIAKAQIWRDLNDLIRTNTDNIKVWDVAAVMSSGGASTCLWYSGDMVDGTHPVNQGYNRMRASNMVNPADLK